MGKLVVSFNCQEAYENGINPNLPIEYACSLGLNVYRVHYSSYGAIYFMEVEGLTLVDKGILSIRNGTWESLEIETL
jgi:hypothetical protein